MSENEESKPLTVELGEKSLQKLAELLASRYSPGYYPIWVDPRFYRPSPTPWWTVTSTSGTSAGVPNTVAQPWNTPDDEVEGK